MKPEPQERDSLAGLVVDGRYSILEMIGTGGTAEVYSAIDNKSGSRVAFKISSADAGPANGFMDNEISRLRGLSHPSIIRCIGEGHLDGKRYAILELLEGSSLDVLMQQGGGLEWGAARDVLIKLCDALSEVHSRSLVHRDLKPANVFVTNGGDVKLIDFGLAAQEGTTEESGTVIGTPSYIAPESVFGKPCDRRTDIYALGIMAYEMLCGERPFSASSVVDVLLMHRDEKPMLPSQASPWLRIPRAIESLIMRALEKEPEGRFQTSADMKAGLETLPEWSAPAMPFGAAFAPTLLDAAV